jgi:FkbM family methyltransferase
MRLNWRHHKEHAFGVYEPAVVNAIHNIVKPGWVCADVGAHLGYITLLLAKQVGPKGKVIAFEPFPNNFQVLQSNIALNGYKNVVLENKAVMDSSGWVSLKPLGDDPLPYSTFAHLGSGGCVAVSLDDYWENRTDRLNFVKIDVEGAEAAVLRGMERILCQDRSILLVELHAFDQQGENHPALQIIRDFNYAVSYLGRRRGKMHVLAQLKE